MAVSDAVPGLSPGISHQTYHATYAPFTPNESEQRLRPLYYRGCWHRVSRLFLFGYYQTQHQLLRGPCSPMTGVYNPKTFILHAASLRQGCPHCEKFSTAATRRCLDRVSVPVWLVILSDQLPVIALVGRYPANKLIGRELIGRPQLAPRLVAERCLSEPHRVLIHVSMGYPPPSGRLFTCYAPVRH